MNLAMYGCFLVFGPAGTTKLPLVEQELAGSPLEQFDVLALVALRVPLGFHNMWLYFATNAFFMLFVIILTMFSTALVLVLLRTPILVSVSILVANYFEFCMSLLKENFTRRGLFFFPYISALFTFLLLANLFGMVPYSFALTSHLILTLAVSFFTFFASVYLCFSIHGLNFFSLFLPAGAPFPLVPFLVVLELISYIARLFSLAIRLFANIMSGHTLLKILASFVWLLAINVSGSFLAPFGIILAVSFLEIGIAMLQAYVFTVLSCIYLNEALVLH
jgi:ATP synthase subunit 6